MEQNKSKYTRLIIPILVIVLLITFISQNLRIIEVNFLMWEGNIRLINLVIICFVMGALSAWILSYFRGHRKKKKAIDVEVEVIEDVEPIKVEPSEESSDTADQK